MVFNMGFYVLNSETYISHVIHIPLESKPPISGYHPVIVSFSMHAETSNCPKLQLVIGKDEKIFIKRWMFRLLTFDFCIRHSLLFHASLFLVLLSFFYFSHSISLLLRIITRKNSRFPKIASDSPGKTWLCLSLI